MAGLLDFLQSASNTAAGNVSAPVDGIAWLLRKAGVPVDTPIGGSDWMAQKGLTRPVHQSGASLAGETFGLLAPMVAAAKAPQIAGGLLQMADNASIPSKMNKQAGVVMFPQGKVSELKYQIEHKPMRIEGGAAPLHDLLQSFGDDIYGKNALQYYGSGDAREKYALQVMAKVRGNPEAKVTIYRGVPDGVEKINPGDWVTIHPDVAKDYGKVIKMDVPASHITSWPDSLLEFGYYPPN